MKVTAQLVVTDAAIATAVTAATDPTPRLRYTAVPTAGRVST